MFFKKKSNKQQRCGNCSSKTSEKFSYCPYCGNPLIDEEKHVKDYGLLGANEEFLETESQSFNFGITDKIIGSLMNGLIKNLGKQFRQFDKKSEKTEISGFPNGIKIRIGPVPAAQKKTAQKSMRHNDISEKQLEKMSSLPREKAETKVKRLNDKIIYELDTPGIESPQDVFVSKLESGYEIKAIGNKKIYVNSLPVNLPLKKVSLGDGKLFVEFLAYDN